MEIFLHAKKKINPSEIIFFSNMTYFAKEFSIMKHKVQLLISWLATSSFAVVTKTYKEKKPRICRDTAVLCNSQWLIKY